VPIGDLVGSRPCGHNGRCRPKHDNRRRVTDTTIHSSRDHATPPMLLRRTSAIGVCPSLVMRNDTAGADSFPFTRPMRLFIRNFRFGPPNRGGMFALAALFVLKLQA